MDHLSNYHFATLKSRLINSDFNRLLPLKKYLLFQYLVIPQHSEILTDQTRHLVTPENLPFILIGHFASTALLNPVAQ